MTNAQKDAIRKIADIIREHFDNGVVAVTIEDDDKNDQIRVQWHGGYANAYGLLELGKIQMIHDREQGYPDSDDI